MGAGEGESFLSKMENPRLNHPTPLPWPSTWGFVLASLTPSHCRCRNWGLQGLGAELAVPSWENTKARGWFLSLSLPGTFHHPAEGFLLSTTPFYPQDNESTGVYTQIPRILFPFSNSLKHPSTLQDTIALGQHLAVAPIHPASPIFCQSFFPWGQLAHTICRGLVDTAMLTPHQTSRPGPRSPRCTSYSLCTQQSIVGSPQRTHHTTHDFDMTGLTPRAGSCTQLGLLHTHTPAEASLCRKTPKQMEVPDPQTFLPAVSVQCLWGHPHKLTSCPHLGAKSWTMYSKWNRIF